MYRSTGASADSPVSFSMRVIADVAASCSVCPKAWLPSYQCRLAFPPVIVFHLCWSSSQVTVWRGRRVSPLPSFTTHCHHTVAPGGSAPDWRISHVHSTDTSLPGVKSGCALAITDPQVNC